MKRTSWSTTILFFIAGILLRLPFRSHFLYHWDSVNFAFGCVQLRYPESSTAAAGLYFVYPAGTIV